MLLCILLVIAAAVFGSKKTVDIFGVNIYLVDNDDIESAPNGGAVLVQKDTAANLDPGKLVLYLKADADDEPTLGYVQEIAARDGIHYITVAYKNSTYEFTESKLVGRADYYSKFWGVAIRFIRTPLGVMMLAVLPCAALILYDIIRAAAANRPEPEVIPKVKNADEKQTHTHTDIRLSVDRDGTASYSKNRDLKKLPKNNGVLFDYTTKQMSTPKTERPIIPLTDKNKQPATKNEVRDNTGKLFDVRISADDLETPDAPAQKSEPRSPMQKNEPKVTLQKPELKTSAEKTAEIAVPSVKSNSGDPFFTQPSAAPQIGRQQRRASANNETPPPRPTIPKTEKTAGKRSTQILASKSFDDLLSDDDDPSYSRGSDKAVDDILAGINNNRKFE